MDVTIELTEQALRNITRMYDRVQYVGDVYGEMSDEHQKMRASLFHCLIGMFRLGGRITAEDDLSLYCVSPTIHYGMNFSPKRLEDGGRDPLLGTWSLNS